MPRAGHADINFYIKRDIAKGSALNFIEKLPLIRIKFFLKSISKTLFISIRTGDDVPYLTIL